MGNGYILAVVYRGFNGILRRSVYKYNWKKWKRNNGFSMPRKEEGKKEDEE